MTNNEMVAQWAATLNAEKAHKELSVILAKYPWLKCPETAAFVDRMNTDLPKIVHIVKLIEKQNMIHRKFIEINKTTDTAIVNAIATQYGLQI